MLERFHDFCLRLSAPQLEIAVENGMPVQNGNSYTIIKATVALTHLDSFSTW